jgi:alpha-ketoglutarate-dependent taurine dioxygenase
MTGYQKIIVRPVAGALGAELDGVRLSEALDDATVAEVRRALLEHQVLFFADQRATPAALKAFAGRFGPLYVHPYARGLPLHPEVVPVVREPDDVGRLFGGSWHTDLTFEDEPVMGSALYAVEVPARGGDTMFASQTASYEALSEGLQKVLVRLNAVHSASVAYGRTTVAGARTMALKTVEEPRDVVHPVVRVHPETGRPGLFVNRLNTRRFEGWSDAESAPLLEFLFSHAVRPEFTCRFRWRPGSLAFWDNRCVQHLALDDYAGQRREMHRVTICGDRPYGVAE